MELDKVLNDLKLDGADKDKTINKEEKEKLDKILENLSIMDRARYEDMAMKVARMGTFRQQVLDVQADPVTAMSAESTKRVAEELETQLSMSIKAPGSD